MRLYCIHDQAADEYGPLFPAVNDAVACRNFRNLIINSQVDVSDDYRLFHVGDYDPKLAVLLPNDGPVLVAFDFSAAQKEEFNA